MAEHEIQIVNTPLQSTSANLTTQPEILEDCHPTMRLLCSGRLVLWCFSGWVFALGLSLASVLTQGLAQWDHPGGSILPWLQLLILGLWIGLLLRTKVLVCLAAGAGYCLGLFFEQHALISLFHSHGEILAPHTDAVSAMRY